MKTKLSAFFKGNSKLIIKNYLFVLLGSILLAVGTGIFLLPATLNTGGLMGLGLIAFHLFGFEPDIVVLILTWAFFLISLLFLGWQFTLKSLLSSLVYPLVLIVLMRVPFFKSFSDGLFTNTDTATILIAGIFGGVFCGVGVALTFLGGGSTGGVDIIVVIINKYFKLKHSVLAFVVDATIIGIGLVVSQDVVLSLIGIISAFVYAFMIEFIFVYKSHVFTAYIISPTKHQEINEWIQKETGRGATLIPVLGGYKRAEYEMIVVNFDRREYALFLQGVAKIDRKAYVMIHQSNAVLGEGFASITPQNEGLAHFKRNKDEK